MAHCFVLNICTIRNILKFWAMPYVATNSTYHLIFPDASHYLNTLIPMSFEGLENNTLKYDALSCLVLCELKDPGRGSEVVSDFFLFLSLLASLSQARFCFFPRLLIETRTASSQKQLQNVEVFSNLLILFCLEVGLKEIL